jgi:hypothetical protein
MIRPFLKAILATAIFSFSPVLLRGVSFDPDYDTVVDFNPRRMGLPDRTVPESWVKGQLQEIEWQALRQYAMKVHKDLVLSGSLSETDLGLFRRYSAIQDPAIGDRYSIPAYRMEKLRSELVDNNGGDFDLWEGSHLSRRELGEIRRQIFPEFKIDKPKEGYSLARYPRIESFSEFGGGGALVFHADGRVTRLPARWQIPKDGNYIP